MSDLNNTEETPGMLNLNYRAYFFCNYFTRGYQLKLNISRPLGVCIIKNIYCMSSADSLEASIDFPAPSDPPSERVRLQY